MHLCPLSAKAANGTDARPFASINKNEKENQKTAKNRNVDKRNFHSRNRNLRWICF